MKNRFSKTELLIDTDAVEKLKKSRVAVFGVGGVGGYAAEALVWSSIGTLDLIDKDKVSVSDIKERLIKK